MRAVLLLLHDSPQFVFESLAFLTQLQVDFARAQAEPGNGGIERMDLIPQFQEYEQESGSVYDRSSGQPTNQACGVAHTRAGDLEDTIRGTVINLLDNYSRYGFIINSAGQIPIETNERLIHLIIDTVKNYNR
jgi:hypothetical protein